MKERVGINFLHSYYTTIKMLKQKNQMKVVDAIMIYSMTGAEPDDFKDELAIAWGLIKPSLDSSIEKYKEKQMNGAKGGAPLGNQNARKYKNNQKQGKTSKTTMEKDKEKDMDMDTYPSTEGYDNSDVPYISFANSSGDDSL